jgi:hypothetical protein
MCSDISLTYPVRQRDSTEAFQTGRDPADTRPRK